MISLQFDRFSRFKRANIENVPYICDSSVIYLGMLSYIKKYPVSLFIILAVIYLSFFKPPSTEISKIPNIDKVVHICMYFGMSGMLWLEFLRAHRRDHTPVWHAWVGAFVCPVLFSGCVELLQEYCTTYRGGDWMDFAANTTGAVLASLIGYFIVRPRILSKK